MTRTFTDRKETDHGQQHSWNPERRQRAAVELGAHEGGHADVLVLGGRMNGAELAAFPKMEGRPNFGGAKVDMWGGGAGMIWEADPVDPFVTARPSAAPGLEQASGGPSKGEDA